MCSLLLCCECVSIAGLVVGYHVKIATVCVLIFSLIGFLQARGGSLKVALNPEQCNQKLVNIKIF